MTDVKELEKRMIAENSGSYNASSMGGMRLGNWGIEDGGPVDSVLDSKEGVNNRTHDLCRNNPHAKSARDNFVSTLIGKGVQVIWDLEDQDLKKELQDKFNIFCRQCDWDGNADLNGLLWIVGSDMFTTGGPLLRFRHIKESKAKSEGLLLPLKLQLLESAHLSQDNRRMASGGFVRNGTFFNKLGLRVGYELYHFHPADEFFDHKKSIIPERDVKHIFAADRPGQITGISMLASAIVKLHTLDQYEDAELLKQATRSNLTGFITQPPTDVMSEYFEQEIKNYAPGNKGKNEGGRRVPFRAIKRGALNYLPWGWDIKFPDGGDIGTNTVDWIKQQIRDVAQASGITYEQLNGDYEGVTFSSIRFAMQMMIRKFDALLARTIIFQMMQPIIDRFISLGVSYNIFEKLKMKDYLANPFKYTKVKFIPHAFQSIKLKDDAAAYQTLMDIGVFSREDVCAIFGKDIDSVDRERKLHPIHTEDSNEN